jgi:hypothetical protein
MYLLISQLLPSNESACKFAPSLQLLVPNSLRAFHHLFFFEGCACNVCDWPLLPSPWLGSHGYYSATAPTAPSVRALVPSGSLIRCDLAQVHHHFLFRGLCFERLSFRFGGDRPLHNVQSLTAHIQMENWTAGLATSSPRVCPTVLLTSSLQAFSFYSISYSSKSACSPSISGP